MNKYTIFNIIQILLFSMKSPSTSSTYKNDINDEDIINETNIQTNLKIAEDSYIDDKIIAANIIECTYDKNFVRYNGINYNISKSNDCNAYVSNGDTVYVPIFVLHYQGMKQSFTPGFYADKHYAENRIIYLEKYRNKFRFHINTDSTIIHSKSENKLYEKIKSSNTKLFNIDAFISFFVSFVFTYMFSLLVVLAINAQNSTDPKNLLLLSVGISLILPSIKMFINYTNTKFETYDIINIDSNEIIDSNIFESEINYKTTTADITIDDSGLTIYSEELDCKWFYERKDNNVLIDKGVELLQKLPTSDGECVITIKDKGYDKNGWVSENKEWYIDTESSFN